MNSPEVPLSPKTEERPFIMALPKKTDASSSTTSESWTMFGKKTQQSKVVFFSQIIAIYIILLVSLISVSLITAGVVFDNGMLSLWSTLLASGLGYLLPSPKLKMKKDV